MTLTFGSLFAGIGGFDLGFERAGMRCVWQVEIDPFCQKVLAKHWPDVERFGDVRECGRHNLQSVDVICGGFPCQPHSLAGKRRGAEDDRDLWPEMRRVVEELQPAWVVGENVPGIRGTILDAVLSDLETLSYQVAVVAIPACGVGAPHKRERIWIVAYHDGQWRETRINADAGDGRALAAETREPAGMGGGQNVADAERDGGRSWRPKRERQEWQTASIGAGEVVADTPLGDGEYLCRVWSALERQARGDVFSNGNLGERTHWAVEPNMGRVAHGIPARVDRLRALGNAVVPQVAEWIGRRIVEVAHEPL